MTTAAIIATYNGEKYIKEQLESIINQTRKIDKIFIFDDKSKDETLKICHEIAHQNNNLIEIHENKKNLGYRKNFEKALLAAKNYDIIFFSDQDDWWFPNKVEYITNEFEKSKDLVLFFSNAYIPNENLAETDEHKVLFNLTFPKKIKKIFKKNPLTVLCYGSTISGCTMAIRNTIISNIIPFSEKWVHDGWIGANACFLGEIKYTDEKLIKYRQNSNQSIGTKKNSLHHKGFDKIKYALSEDAAQKEIDFLNSKLENLYEFKNFTVAKNADKDFSGADRAISFLEALKKNYSRNLISKLLFFISNSLNGNYSLFRIPLSHRVRDIFLHIKK